MTSPLLFDRLAREFMHSRNREVEELALEPERRPAPRRPTKRRPDRQRRDRGPRSRRSLGMG